MVDMREICRRKDDRGVTLVEMIIVIAIISVLAGASIFLYGLIPSGRVNSVARKTESGLEKTRNNALSFYGADYVFSMTNGAYYGLIRVDRDMDGATDDMVNQGEAEELGKAVKVTVYCKGAAAGSTEESYVLQNGNSMTISFDRSSGAFKPMAGTFVNGGGTARSISETDNIYLTKIEVTSGMGHKRTIVCTRLTGKMSVE
jgi:prepilin-type N-terminal cleavage/methylation domain-containing protein